MKRMEMGPGEGTGNEVGALVDLRQEPDYPKTLEKINKRVAQVLGDEVETENYSHNIPYCINRIRLLNIMLEMVQNRSMNINLFMVYCTLDNLSLEKILPDGKLNAYYAGTNKGN